MLIVATTSTATLSGQVATPRIVSGVTIAPNRVPIMTKATRVTGAGTRVGRPASDAIATASTDPETSPAGIPSQAKETPPAAAISRVSSGGRMLRGAAGNGIACDQCRVRRKPSNGSPIPSTIHSRVYLGGVGQ